MSEGIPGHRSPDPGAISSGSEVELLVNGEPLRVATPCRVDGLLETLALGDKRVAVALNGEVVIRSRYADAELVAGDRVEILEAVGGG